MGRFPETLVLETMISDLVDKYLEDSEYKNNEDYIKKVILSCRKNAIRKLMDLDKKKGNCPECGGVLTKRNGVNGEFIGCTNFPQCKYNKNMYSSNPHGYYLGDTYWGNDDGSGEGPF